MGNNWMNGIGPSGENWLGDFFKRNWNSLKIIGGLFTTDPHKNFFGRLWENISKLTQQVPQESLGFAAAEFTNAFGGVDNASYFNGATVLKGYGSGKDYTLGNFIIADGNISTDPNNPDLQHEYGHYLQSEKYGWSFLSYLALPNVLHTEPSGYPENNTSFIGWIDQRLGTSVPGDLSNWRHDPTEVDGNTRAYAYWQKYYPSVSFNTYYNPIGSLRNPGFFDYALTLTTPMPIFEGIFYAYQTKGY